MPLTTLLFDLDGTLLETEPGILGCFRHTLSTLGLPPKTDAELRRFIGPPLKQAWGELVGDGLIDTAVETYRRCYDAKGKLEANHYPGLVEALQTLSRQYRLVVATSKRRAFAEDMTLHFGLRPLFAAVYGVLPENLSEHKAQLIGRILADLELSPAEALMIGDREFDVSGAKAHGMQSLGVLWGYGSREELEGSGADLLCEQPSGLLEAVRMLSEGLSPARPGSGLFQAPPS